MTDDLQPSVGESNVNDMRPRRRPMDHWGARLTQTVARQVSAWRAVRQMTAQDLERATQVLGHKVSKSTIANLENDRRDSISLAELLVLAAALDVPPVLLIAPIGREGDVEVLPGVTVSPWEARGWLHGAALAPYEPQSYEAWVSAQAVLTMYEAHRSLVRRYDGAQKRLRTIGEELASTPRPESAQEVQKVISDRLNLISREVHNVVSELVAHRRRMRDQGHIAPGLPLELRELVSVHEGEERLDFRGEAAQAMLVELVTKNVLQGIESGAERLASAEGQ